MKIPVGSAIGATVGFVAMMMSLASETPNVALVGLHAFILMINLLLGMFLVANQLFRALKESNRTSVYH